MNARIIIGKNFGDEGKGLATDFFARLARQNNKDCLTVRFNGGAQAGHTVDLPGERMVFHQLSSGSFRGALTYWAEDFLPDMYKLGEEAAELAAMGRRVPVIFASPLCRCVYIDDVLINMALETRRGANRHGSCGMGIDEAVQRSKRFCLSLETVVTDTAEKLYHRLRAVRLRYLAIRLAELDLSLSEAGEYGELLQSDAVLRNAAERMKRNAELVTLTGGDVAQGYDEVIFEGAQGLLLDENRTEFAPHLTSSRTGVFNAARFIEKHLPGADTEVVYVTRAYVTRHGAGSLPHEDSGIKTRYNITDRTNITNEWQGSLRFARHGSPGDFLRPVTDDIKAAAPHTLSLFVTHLNETGGKLLTAGGDLAQSEWIKAYGGVFDRIYLSSTPFSRDII